MRTFGSPRRALVPALALALVASACASAPPPAAKPPKGKASAKECDAIVAVINRAFRRVRGASKPADERDEIDQLKLMSEALGTAGRDAEALGITSPELAEVRREYASFARAVGRAAHDLADAAEARDKEGIELCRQRLHVLTEEEDPIFERLNAVCR